VNALTEPVIYTFLQALPIPVKASKRSPGYSPDSLLQEELSLTRAVALLSGAFVALAVASHAAAQAPHKQLTVEDIFAHGPLVPKPPATLAWSPDGKHLTYLDGGELMDVDPVTGKVHVMVSAAKMDSLGGKPGSERDRDHRERYNMAMAPSGSTTCITARACRSALPAPLPAMIQSSRPTAPASHSFAIMRSPSYIFAHQACPPLLSRPCPALRQAKGNQY
jgi:hypothetical protein